MGNAPHKGIAIYRSQSLQTRGGSLQSVISCGLGGKSKDPITLATPLPLLWLG